LDQTVLLNQQIQLQQQQLEQLLKQNSTLLQGAQNQPNLNGQGLSNTNSAQNGQQSLPAQFFHTPQLANPSASATLPWFGSPQQHEGPVGGTIIGAGVPFVTPATAITASNTITPNTRAPLPLSLQMTHLTPTQPLFQPQQPTQLQQQQLNGQQPSSGQQQQQQQPQLQLQQLQYPFPQPQPGFVTPTNNMANATNPNNLTGPQQFKSPNTGSNDQMILNHQQQGQKSTPSLTTTRPQHRSNHHHNHHTPGMTSPQPGSGPTPNRNIVHVPTGTGTPFKSKQVAQKGTIVDGGGKAKAQKSLMQLFDAPPE
jgi:hypothetical protein